MQTAEFGDLFLTVFEDVFKPNPEKDGFGVTLNGKVLTEEFLLWYKTQLNDFKNQTTDAHAKPTGNTEIQAVEGDKIEESVEEIEENVEEIISHQNTWCDEIINQMHLQAEFLGGKKGDSNPNSRMVRAWGLQNNGAPLPISFETMMSFGAKGLNQFFQWCAFEAGKVKKTKETT